MSEEVDLKEIVKYSKKLRVLYVEDDQETRESTVSLFENFFDFITVAVNGQEGLEKFREGEYDLIFSDINMPVMGGFEMIKNIRAQDEEVVIITISAHDKESFRDEIDRYDVAQYIIKPFYFERLIEALQICVSKMRDANG